MAQLKKAWWRTSRVVSIPALLLSLAGLFTPIFFVYHQSLNIWQVHHACALVSAALAKGPTTMAILMPPLFGSVHRTCPTIAMVWPVLVGIGLFGVVSGVSALLGTYERTTVK